MSRPLRVEFPGALYHVSSRGNAQQPVFLDDGDCERLLDLLGRTCERFAWRCHAYCVMGNHYHLVVETPRANLARGMQQLGSSYAQGFNRRYGRVGHVLQGRYKAVLVERQTHLLEVARYVVLNPVRAGLCGDAGGWRWSSYRATVGEGPALAFLTVDWLLAQFGKDPVRGRERYRSFVREGGHEAGRVSSPSRLYAATNDFVRQVAPQVEETVAIVRAEREPIRTALADLFAKEAARALLLAYREHGYRLREIADHLGVHPSTVSRRLRRAEAALCRKL